MVTTSKYDVCMKSEEDMRDYYPLVAAQKMHHNWILNYKTQQVSGVSVIASLKAELDFGLLKKCIQLEFERSGCMRLRFTKPDKNGQVMQYIVDRDSRDIPIKDLSGMTMEEAKHELIIRINEYFTEQT